MKLRIGVLVATAMLFGFSSNALASGFALAEQSVSGLGNAFAGGAAIADQASTIYFNPAGMTRLNGKSVEVGLHIISTEAKYKDLGSTSAAPVLGSKNGKDAGVVGTVPNLYYTETFDKGWSFGLGVNVPFGLATKYSSDWVGRYHGVKSELQTININPSAAHKVNDHFSYGFGLSAQYLDAELSNAVFTGTPTDDYVTLSGDSWGYGYNLGFLYEFNEGCRVGFSYRSEISHDIKGDADFGFAAPDQGVKSDVDLPASASLSYYHDFTDKFSFMTDISWTEWSSVPELRFVFDVNPTDGVTTLNWDDTFRYSVGATYKLNENLVLRGGLAYDESPIPDRAHRAVRIPGEDRTWITVGAGYKMNNSWSFDAAFAHIIVDDPVIDKRTGPLLTEDAAKGYIYGEYDASVNIISASMNYNF